MFNFFKSSPPIKLLSLEPDDLKKTYRRHQWGVILNLILGYSFFYTTRLSLSVAKKPLLDTGILTKEELGFMGTALFFTYAIGKFTNGFLSDYANIRKFMSFGLFCSALINIFLGFSTSAFCFIILWGVNGWFQSMGSAPSGVSIFQWFSPSQRGSRYSVWAGSHNIGEGISFILTAFIISSFGWRSGFITPGILSLIVVISMLYFLRDKPQTLGLPDPATAFEEKPDPVKKGSTISAQLYILKNPVLWVIALSCATMYIERYAINSWGILYLQTTKGYSLTESGAILSLYPIAGLIGAVLSGTISDKVFNSNRPIPILIYHLLSISGLVLLFFGPNSFINDSIALSLFGFGIGGLVVFLAGLFAADLMPKNSVGAVKGFLGLFSYTGAAFQEYMSSKLIIESNIGSEKIYDFSLAINFWIGSGLVSLFLILLVWKQKPQA